MSTTISIPVEITSEAAARIAELGLENEIQTMIEHTVQSVPELHSVEVTRYDDPYEAVESRIVVTAWRHKSPVDNYDVWNEWIGWYVRAFADNVSNKVYRYVGFDAFDRDTYAG